MMADTPPTRGLRAKPPPQRDSSVLLRFDLRLPGRVKEELKAGRMHSRAVREYTDKSTIRPVMVKTGRHECLRRYFDRLDKDGSGSIELHEMERWLPKIGLNDNAAAEAIQAHFAFMDKNDDGDIDFKEFAKATLDASSQKLGNYEDEQYVKKFGLEMYMFLALTARHKSLKDFERDMAKSYESGNELLPFLQFERLITASQAPFMPFEFHKERPSSVAAPPTSTTKEPKSGRGGNTQAISTRTRSALKTGGETTAAASSSSLLPAVGAPPGKAAADANSDLLSDPHTPKPDLKSTSSSSSRRTSFLDPEAPTPNAGGRGGSDVNSAEKRLSSQGGLNHTSSSQQHHQSAQPLMGFEHLWGLGPEVAEVEAGLRENRRKWAIKKRNRIAAEAIASGRGGRSTGSSVGSGGASNGLKSHIPGEGIPRKSALKSTSSLPKL